MKYVIKGKLSHAILVNPILVRFMDNGQDDKLQYVEGP